MGDVTPLSTTTGILDAIAAGAVAADRSLNLQTGNYCPAGTLYNPALGVCQSGVSVTASAGGNGMMLLLIAGAVLFFMSRGR
jgi:outer membrane lipoprotein SlyB